MFILNIYLTIFCDIDHGFITPFMMQLYLIRIMAVLTIVTGCIVMVDMQIKESFLRSLYELLASRNLETQDIYKKTSIGRTKLRAILDPESNTYPDLKQMLELCKLLNTTLYYLAEKRGPRDAAPAFTNAMIDIMEAYLDDERPEISQIIDYIIGVEDEEALVMIRKLTSSVISARKAFSEDNSLAKALIRNLGYPS